jgi:pyrroloquinoline quinone biosynthesis protein B
MLLKVLGTAAGGGYPQWNCACRLCTLARLGEQSCASRLQDCVAVSGDGAAWYLLNASPDVGTQIESFLAIQPGPGPRETPIRGVLLTDAELDHASGLLALRQAAKLDVFATEPVLDALCESLALSRILAAFGTIRWVSVAPGRSFELAGGLEARALPLGGASPRFLGRECGPEWSVAYRLEHRATGGVAIYAAGLRDWSEPLSRELAEADCLLIDGTFWSETEMADAGVGHRSAFEMGHLPIGGPEGSAIRLAQLPARRRIYVHINNTNPIVDERSEGYAQLVAAGIEVGRDGMQLEV